MIKCALFQSLVIFFVSMATYHESNVDIWEFGTVICTTCLAAMLSHLAIETKSWVMVLKKELFLYHNFFLCLDNYPLVIYFAVSIFIFFVRPRLQWILHNMLWPSKSILGCSTFHGDSGILAHWIFVLCTFHSAKVVAFEIYNFQHFQDSLLT